VRTPSPDELEAFFRHDGWIDVRSTDHVPCEKRLATGELLESHRSFGDRPLGPRVFKLLLAIQLRINEAEFWEVLRTKKPARRPSPAPEPRPETLPLWLGQSLERMGVPRERLAALGRAEAEALLDELRSRPRPKD